MFLYYDGKILLSIRFYKNYGNHVLKFDIFVELQLLLLLSLNQQTHCDIVLNQ